MNRSHHMKPIYTKYLKLVILRSTNDTSLWQYWWYLFWKKGCLALALYVTLSACYADEQKSCIMSIVFTARIFNYTSKMRSVDAWVFFQAPLLNKEIEKVLIRVKVSSCRGLLTHWIFGGLPWELTEAHTVLSVIHFSLTENNQIDKGQVLAATVQLR